MIKPLLDYKYDDDKFRYKIWLEFKYNMGGEKNFTKILIPCIPKLANSTINMFYNKLNNRKVEYKTKYQHLSDDAFNLDHYIDIREYNLDDCLVVCIIRDQLERIISSYNTFTNIDAHNYQMTFDEYIKSVILTLNNYDICEQDRHIRSQFWFYDIDKVDLFVHINKLDYFLKTINTKYVERYNVSKVKQNFIYNKELYRLLKNDYIIYNNILNSNKIY